MGLSTAEEKEFFELVSKYTDFWRHRENFDAWKDARLVQERHRAGDVHNFEVTVHEFQGRPPERNASILEIGSGMGGLLVAFRLAGYDGVKGIEYNRDYCRITELRARRNGVFVDLANGAAENLPYMDHSMDYVFCIDVLEHVRNPIAAIREMNRVLRPGGLAWVTIVNRFALRDPHYHRYLVNHMPSRLGQFFADRLSPKTGHHNPDHQKLTDMHYFTYGRIRKLFRSCGFEPFDSTERQARDSGHRLVKAIHLLRCFQLSYWIYSRLVCAGTDWVLRKQ